MMFRWVVVVALAVLGITARAASPGCGKASRPEEKAVCGQADLRAVDRKTMAAYRRALRPLSAQAAGLIRIDQIKWGAWIAKVCRAADSHDEAALANCMIGEYRVRAEVLAAAVFRRGGTVFFTRTAYLAKAEPVPEFTGGVSFPGFGTLTAAWLQADSSEPEWTEWNAMMERTALKACGDQSSWKNEIAEGADSEMSMRLQRMTSALVAVEVGTFLMGHGAAHPNHWFQQVNWLRREGRVLRAEDVFRGESRWRPAVAKICWNFLNEELGQDALMIKGPSDRGLIEVVSSPANWTLDAKGLSIGFPDYAVSGHTSPSPEALLTWRWLKPFLVPGSPINK